MIRTLASPIATSRLVRGCKEYLNEMGLNNQITLIWVPAHSNIEGSEKADEFPRKGSRTRTYGPEPGLPISQAHCKKVVRE